MIFRSWPGHTTRLEVKIGGGPVQTFIVGDGVGSEISLLWPGTLLPVTAQFTAETALRVVQDPRLFGVCLSKVVCLAT